MPDMQTMSDYGSAPATNPSPLPQTGDPLAVDHSLGILKCDINIESIKTGIFFYLPSTRKLKHQWVCGSTL